MSQLVLILLKLYNLLFPSGNSKKSFRKECIRCILMIELTKLGDVIVAFPAARALRKEFLNADIDFLAESFIKELIVHNKDITNCLCFDRTNSLKGLFQAVLAVRKKRYDLVLSIGPSFRNALLTLMSRSTYKAGFIEGAGSKTPFLTDNAVSTIGFSINNPVVFRKGENIYSRPFKVLEALGISKTSDRYTLDIPEDFKESAERFFLEHRIKKRVLVIQPLSPWRYRSYPHDKMLSLINKLYSSLDIQIVLIGSSKERSEMDIFAKGIKREAVIVAGMPLLFVAAIIRRASLYIGSDSGPIHLAHAAGTPVVGLYGPVSPDITAPLGENNIFFYKKVDCSPCDQEYCRRPKNYCMSLIRVEDVYDSVKNILKND